MNITNFINKNELAILMSQEKMAHQLLLDADLPEETADFALVNFSMNSGIKINDLFDPQSILSKRIH
ncbi:MAG: hypothetical protein V4544_04840 [Pseudomonadota bacterium]